MVSSRTRSANHRRHRLASRTRQQISSRSTYKNSLHRRSQSPKAHSTLRSTTRNSKAIVNQATAFYLFNKLPTELRINIWRMTLEEDRLVTITPEFDCDSLAWQVRVEEKKVQALRVCQESRGEALREYTPIEYNDKGNCTYVNWSQDTIFFDFPSRTIPSIEPVLLLFQELHMVQSLAVGLYMRPGPNFLDLLSQFNPLQRLMFVNDGHGQGWGRGGTTRLTLKHLAPHFFTVKEIPRQYSDHICENLDKHPHLRNLQTSLVWRSEIDDADIEQSTFPLKKEKKEEKKDDNVLSRRGGFFNCLTQDTM